MAFPWISLKFTRFSLATALLGMSALASGTLAASAADLRAMSAEDIRGLQQRLADAKCYAGAIDGTANPATEAAIKACPVMDPILSIETGMHTAVINRIGVDRECRLLATGSSDKTARLWSLPEGRLLRTLRPPIGPDEGGRVHSVALSPDGRIVAAGGWDARASSQPGHAVYLFDAATGALKARVGSFESSVNHLTFSPDGHFLAATLGGSKGLRVIDTERMREVAADRDYGEGSQGAAFAADGRLFTVAYDGYIRAYDAAFRLVKKVQTSGGRQAHSVAVDPTGQQVAVGFDDSPAVEVYKTSDLSFAFAADITGIQKEKNLGAVTWSSDGQQLVAGGTYQKLVSGAWKDLVVLWGGRGQGSRNEQAVSLSSRIFHILPCGTGFAVGAGEPLFALLDRDGKPRLTKSGVSVDMRSKRGEALQVSRDGRQVRFGLGVGKASPALFDLAGATLTKDGTAPELAAAKIDGIAVTDWQSNTAPKLDGKELKLQQRERSRSLAITPDGARFVLGTTYKVRAFDQQGREQWNKPGPGEADGVNVTGDGRLALAAYSDGTIRWYRLSDGQELLTLFVNKDDLRWVAWTPSGYYLASPGGENLIGWHLNRGWDQAADFFGASRFRERFSRPDVVQKVLETLDEGKAVEEANGAARRREDTKPMIAQLPPVIRLLTPGDGSRFSGNDLAVNYELRSPSGLQVTRIDVLIDGRISRGLGRVEPSRSLCGDASAKPCTGTLTVSVPARDVEVALIAYAGELAGEPARVKLAWAGAAAPAPADLLKPKLYALVVGVSDYAAPGLKLGYAAKDARDFATALQGQRGGLYGSVETRLIIDREATRNSVVDGLEWLEKQVTSRDVGVVFIAGHGVSDEKQNYWFLPADAIPERLRTMAVSQDDIKRTLQGLPGKALLFLDTCHAGQAMASGTRRGTVDVNALVNELSAAENGVIAFASSTGREVSMERDDWKNGAFTKAIVEGLVEGRADLLHQGTITLSQLDAFVVSRVKELTGGTQHPVMTRPPTVPDFAIALVRAP